MPLFEALAARDDCELMVVYETFMESNRSWTPTSNRGYPSVVLNSRTITGGRLAPETRVHIPRRPLAELVRFGPEVVVASGGVWSSPVNIGAMLRRHRHAWAFVPWWGEFPDPTRRAARKIVEPWKRKFVRAGDAWLAYSSRSQQDAIRLGADPERVIIAPNTAEQGPPPSPRRRPSGTRRRILFSGQLIKRKGILVLLEACRSLPNIDLVIAGDGPLRPIVEQRVSWDPSVEYLGHLDQSELTRAYARADALVLPSLYEVWGLVINEALAQGIPVVASDQVAAADHLLEPGVTGHIVPAGDPVALRGAIAKLARWTAADYDLCGDAARIALADWSPERAADAVIRASRLATLHRRPEPLPSAPSWRL